MASKIDICNLALVRLNLHKIQSLGQTSKEAQVLNAIYDIALDSALRAHPWNFATRQEYLALLNEEYPRFAFAYQLPAQCLMAREIYNGRGNDRVEFEIIRGNSGGQIVLTDQENAALIYTERVTDANAYDSLFISAFAYYLASELAVSIKSNSALQAQMLQLYHQTVSQARAADANEGRERPDNSCSYAEARQ